LDSPSIGGGISNVQLPSPAIDPVEGWGPSTPA
jgi:hypothetical protein